MIEESAIFKDRVPKYLIKRSTSENQRLSKLGFVSQVTAEKY